jgi:hypothetical protein
MKDKIEKAIGEFVQDIISAYNYADIDPQKSQDKLVAFIQDLLQQRTEEIVDKLENDFSGRTNTKRMQDETVINAFEPFKFLDEIRDKYQSNLSKQSKCRHEYGQEYNGYFGGENANIFICNDCGMIQKVSKQSNLSKQSK